MVEIIDNGNLRVSRRVIVSAPAGEIFDLVVNPHRHHEIDGSGTVGENIAGPERLSTGDTFTTHMKMFGLPYRTTSTATQVNENAVIEWQLGAGQRWRWELQSLTADSTQITETWDIRDIPPIMARIFRWTGMYGRNARGIEETLRRLQRRFG